MAIEYGIDIFKGVLIKKNLEQLNSSFKRHPSLPFITPRGKNIIDQIPVSTLLKRRQSKNIIAESLPES